MVSRWRKFKIGKWVEVVWSKNDRDWDNKWCILGWKWEVMERYYGVNWGKVWGGVDDFWSWKIDKEI